MISNSKYKALNTKQIRNTKFKIFKPGFTVLTTLLALLLLNTLQADNLDNSILMRAMQDELNRNITGLQIENQAKPYYISYRVRDAENTEIKAEFGGLIYSNYHRSRDIYVDLRVGSYDFDNSNFVGPSIGSSLIECEHTNLPLEDDYDALRNSIWLVTDGTYKNALERLSRKKAVIQNQQVKDSIADFLPPLICKQVEPEAKMVFDKTVWEKNIVQISKVFQKFPKIYESGVAFHLNASKQYFIDTEGNQSRRADLNTFIEIFAKTQTEDGDRLEDFIGFYGQTPDNLPDITTITEAVKAMAETLSLQVALKKEESYSGPVLFIGQAAAELIFQILGKGVSDPRTPLYENDLIAQSANQENLGSLTGRIGRKVMPDFLSAYDDPNLIEWGKTALFGHFSIDDQGAKSERVDIVKDGKLTGVMMSRSPIKKITESNGHGRYRNETYGARVCGLPGNLIIESKNAQSFEELRNMLINIGKDYGNSYGIIVTRLEPTKPQSTNERYMRYYTVMPGALKPTLSSPMVAYKIDLATGKIELIRGLDFSSVTSRLLRDISAVGDDNFVYNFLYRDENGNEYPVSVIAPAILVEEMDLVTKETKPTKLPILKHPYFKNKIDKYHNYNYNLTKKFN